MKKSSLLFMLLAATALTWIHKPAGVSLVDRFRISLRLGEDDAVRALAWLRTEVHNLTVADAQDQWVEDERQAASALCEAIDLEPAAYMWVDDAVLNGEPRRVDFPMSKALEQLAQRLRSAAVASGAAVAPTRENRYRKHHRQPVPPREHPREQNKFERRMLAAAQKGALDLQSLLHRSEPTGAMATRRTGH